MSTATASPATSETANKPREYTLNALDRCDRDGAQAYVRAILEGGLDLLFCRHHWLKFKPLMEEQGILDSFIDETDRLDENRLKGSEN
jgi:hypothetical protein